MFIIKTDHKPLQYLFEAELTNRKIQQWAIKLSGYNCRIEYLAGRDNTWADLLSRIPRALEEESVDIMPEVDDRAYHINVINSQKIGRQSSLGELEDSSEIEEE